MLIKSWTWAYLGMIVALGLVGPFVTRFRLPVKFLSISLSNWKLFQTGEILDINIWGCLLAVTLPLSLCLLIHSYRNSQSWAIQSAYFLIFLLL